MNGLDLTATPADSVVTLPCSRTDPKFSVIPQEHRGLSDARATERLGAYLVNLWNRREYAWYVANSELKSRQINSLLGNLWHLLNPMLQIAVFYLFFGIILEADRGVENFIGYLTVGVLTYGFMQKSVMAGSKSLDKYRGLIQSISFPRSMLPLTTTLTEALASIPAYSVIVLVAVLTGETVSITWLLLIPFFVAQTLLNAGMALIAARMASRLPDIQQILPFVFRLGFYASGVLFNVNAYLEDSRWRILFVFNPAYCFIEINRGAILDDTTLNWTLVAISVGWALLYSILGFLWFRKAEDQYGQR